MALKQYIDLDRTFYQLTKSNKTDELEKEFESTLPLFERGINWEDLVNQSRVIILSEAGSGKSSEIYQATKKLRNQNFHAFFLRIEDIVDNVDGFEIGTVDEFNNWLQGEKSAWIFLDSVDEAKLSDPRDFSKAIRRFGRMIESGLERAFIFITSRASSWSHKTDLDLCNQYLPLNSSENYDFSKECFKVYSLTDLDGEQVEKFLDANNVPDKERFLAETSRQEARMFTSRPQDLLELISYWKRHGSIGSKYQLIQDSIDWRLAEIDEIRAQANSISTEKLRDGVEKVAVAMILMKIFTVRIADGTNDSEGINLRNVLPDWDNRDCTTLLSRPIFDDAIYGSVRFHHRSVREYLAARWFFNRLNDGSPRSPVENLFFKSHYGVNVIVPSMRHILPWLAQMDEKIRQRVIEIDPHAILEGGDPKMFPSYIREQLLDKVCQAAHDRGSNWHFNNWESVKKMAKHDIGNKINQLLKRYSDDSTIISLLLDSVTSGGLDICLPEALTLAINTSLDSHARIAAINVIRNLGDDSDMGNVRKFYQSNLNQVDRSLAKELITGLRDDKESIKWLLTIIISVSDVDDYRMSGLSLQLIEFTNTLDLSNAAEFGKDIVEILFREPYIESGYCKISKRHSWLFDIGIAIVERLLSSRNPLAFYSGFADLILQIHQLRHYNVIRRDNNVISAIAKWLDFKHYLYWHCIEKKRKKLIDENIRLWSCFQMLFVDNELDFNEDDIPYILEKINTSASRDNQLVALTLCLRVYKENEKPQNLLCCIKRAIAQDSEMKEVLSNFLRPPKLSKEERAFATKSKSYENKLATRERKKAKILNDVVNKIKLNPDQLRNHGFGEGKISQFQYYLFEKTSSKGINELNDVIKTDWQLLIPIIGEEGAIAYRDGITSFWRQYEPKWSTETGKAELEVFLFFALSGLQIEASEVKDWHDSLNSEEFNLACKYAFANLNDFPIWFAGLIKRNPKKVTGLIFEEIEREASMKVESSTMILRIFYQHKAIWSTLGRGLMLRLREEQINVHDVGHAIRIVESLEDISDIEIANLASDKCKNLQKSENLSIWYATWIGVDPDKAIKTLTVYLEAFESVTEAQEFVMQMISSLMGTRGRGGEVRKNFKNPRSLKELILLSNSYIRREEDFKRAGTGVYSPGLRDEAQDARNRLETILKDISGKDSFLVMMELAQSHPYVPYRKWMVSDAKDRATIDSAFAPYSETNFREFCATLERTPSNHKELYDLVVLRLLDLKADLEDGDTSYAYSLINEQKETRVRNVIGGWCRDRANSRYSVAQEDELADGRKPDLRFFGNSFDGPISVELKLANKWKSDALIERLENQLCGDYLRDIRSSYGIFLLINQSSDAWTFGGKALNFQELVSMLEAHWDEISKDHPSINDVKIIGIDLLKRSP
ncbi:NACHT domain-containing protein [Dyadobacter subterraneus]|uniref:ATP-binding protein n=1 Tax=Dyadobacter subterraneus TaxID=2773304 RepID=A0ABR9W596_9BACT|nr:hypothetical protein [Dyadobacter subterraneus]MBE9460593.1 hypothetical protein [Dyadobacter subterraneus]